jgi:hypothetical protein
MALRQVIELANGAVEVEERNGYLFVVETGQLRSVREVAAYAKAMQAVITQSGISRALIDARAEVGDPPIEVRNAMWEWLASPDRGFTMVAFVLPSEMAVARVNMTALSRKASVRAFDSVQQATRWLARSTRPGSTVSMPALATGSSNPPRRSNTPEAHAPTEPPPPALDPPPPFEASRLPPPPSVPRETSPRRASDQGFRPPTPGPSEHTAGRASRPSELRERGPRQRRTTPPKGGKVA